jgi:hypothetical protein
MRVGIQVMPHVNQNAPSGFLIAVFGFQKLDVTLQLLGSEVGGHV